MVGGAVAVADGAAARLGVAVGGARRARPLVGVVPLKTTSDRQALEKKNRQPQEQGESSRRERREPQISYLWRKLHGS